MSEPIPMLLFCPRCAWQHVDSPQPEKGWDNPPHRSHECQMCGHVWRQADVPTTGVQSIATKGQRDGSASPSVAGTSMTEYHMWKRYACAALPVVDDGLGSLELERRASVAAKVADAMLLEDRKRWGEP